MKSSFYIKKIARKLLPVGSKRHHAVRRLLERVHARQDNVLSYEQWVAQVEPNTIATAPAEGPLISILVPAYNTPDKYLQPLIDGILAQTYTNWELVLVNGSPIEERRLAISAAARRDERIREILLTTNKGIADTTNQGFAHAQGEFIAFMDHDDTLAPFALAEVAAALQKDPDIGLFYSDEDKLSDDGQHRLLPLFKPAWSPELFLNVNYLAHFVVVRAALAHQVGGIRLGFDGAQDYDFLLRVLDTKPKVHAVQRMSYHWRQAAGSTGLDVGEKSGASDAGLKALRDYIKRNKISAEAVEIVGRPTEYRLKYAVQGEPMVYVWPVGQAAEADFEELKRQTAYSALTLVSSPTELKAKDGLVLRLDMSARPKQPDWLNELIGLAQQSGVGWVGGALVNAGDQSQGIGYVGDGETWQPLFAGQPLSAWTLMGPAVWPRDLLAVSPDCALIELSKLSSVVAAGDVVMSGAATFQAGLRNVYWPYAKLENEHMLTAQAAPAAVKDGYFNPNLAVQNGLPILRP